MYSVTQMNCSGNDCPGCGSTPRPCEICSDADCGYTEQAGTSSITDGTIECYDANTIVTSDTADTTSAVEQRVTADFVGFASGDEARLFVKYKDANNYWFAQATVGSNLLRIYERSGGTTTLRASTSATINDSTTYTLSVCYGNDVVTAGVHEPGKAGTAATIYATTTNITDGQTCGVGCGALNGFVSFSNLVFRYADAGCQTCLCDVNRDEFTGSDSSDVNTGSPVGWTEVAGDWSRASNRVQVSSANAILLATQELPGPPGGFRVYSGVVSGSAGDKWRIIIDYVDANNYLCAEFEAASGGRGRMSFIRRTGGSETELVGFDGGSSFLNYSGASTPKHTIGICHDLDNERLYAFYNHVAAEEMIQATSSTSAVLCLLNQGELTSYKCGLGTGDTVGGTMVFDNFDINRKGLSCESCDPQSTPCQASDGLVAEVYVTLGGHAGAGCGDCGSINAAYTCTYIGRTIAQNGASTWRYEFPTPICGAKFLDHYRGNTGTTGTRLMSDDLAGSGLQTWISTNSTQCQTRPYSPGTFGAEWDCDPDGGSPVGTASVTW